MRPLSSPGYLIWLAAVAVLTLGLVWAYVVLAPMGFMDDEYPRWTAKSRMLAECQLGSTLVLGDSRAAVDIAPDRLGGGMTNLALAGSSTIEAYFTLRRALRCPHPPKLALISISLSHFPRPDTFWSKTVRYGFLDAADLRQVWRASLRTGDMSVMDSQNATDRLPVAVRIPLYAWHFPSVDFASLYQRHVFLAWWRNHRIEAEVRRARGQYFFSWHHGSDGIAPEADLAAFSVAPVIDHYLDATLRLLTAHRIPADFIEMPVSDATWAAMKPGVVADFAAYLRGYERRYPGFHVLGPPLPHWPDRYFGDPLNHMNPDGVSLLSPPLRACLDGLRCRLAFRGQVNAGL